MVTHNELSPKIRLSDVLGVSGSFIDTEHGEEDKDSERQMLLRHDRKKTCYIPARVVLVIWSFLGFVTMFTTRMDINIVILDMVRAENRTLIVQLTNSSPQIEVDRVDHEGKFHWTDNQQYLLLSAFFYGYSSTQVLGGYLSDRFGGKMTFGLGVLVTSLLSLSTPWAAWSGYNLLVALRVGQGLAQGLAQPSMHSIWSRWAPDSEKSILMSIVYAGCQLGTILASEVSSALCQLEFLGGWPSTFYLFGTCGVAWSIHWFLLVYDDPSQHPRISCQEKEYIQRGKTCATIQRQVSPVWTRVLTSPALYAIIASHFANDWGYFALMTCLPKYLKSVLLYDLTESGYLTSLPSLVLLCTSPLSGSITDAIRERRLLSTKNSRKLINSIGLFIPAGLMLAACLLDSSSRTVTVALIISAVGINGFTQAGYCVNHLDIAPSFAGILFGVTNTIGTTTGFIGPVILGTLTDSQSVNNQWHIFFYMTAAIFFIGGLVFLLFAQGEPQDWLAPVGDCSLEGETHLSQGVGHLQNVISDINHVSQHKHKD